MKRQMVIALQNFCCENTITEKIVEEFELALRYIGKMNAEPIQHNDMKLSLVEVQPHVPEVVPMTLGQALHQARQVHRIPDDIAVLIPEHVTPVIPPHVDDVIENMARPVALEGNVKEGGQ